jgi:glycosyltransferase involved in cell wall biosynthesis
MSKYAGKILMVVENRFPGDPRVTQEALTLTQNNYKVSVICLAKKDQRRLEKWNDISVYRIPTLHLAKKNAKINNRHLILFKSTFGYTIEYAYFTLASFLLSVLVLFKEGFNVVHAHNPPDTIFLWAFFYKLLGKGFVFDHHDLAPEMYLAKYNRNKDLIYKTLLFAEKITLCVADRVISTNNSYRDIEIQRNKISPEKLYVVRNGPDLNIVKHSGNSKQELRISDKVKLAYAGMINTQDGLDYLLRSIRILIFELDTKDFQCYIFGSGDAYYDMKRYSDELGINNWVEFKGLINRDLLFRYLSVADICLAPEPLNEYNNNSTFVKVMEYMALGKPIVAFDLKETRYSAQGAAMYVKPNDELDFAKAIAKLINDPKMRKKMGTIGKKRVRQELSWNQISRNLIRAYETLFDG